MQRLIKKIKKLKSATEPATPDIIKPLPKNEGKSANVFLIRFLSQYLIFFKTVFVH